MTTDNTQPWSHPEIRLANGLQYFIGFALSLAFLGVGLILVEERALAPVSMLETLSFLAFLTTLAKLVFLFHLDFSETQRWNTLTLILNVPLLVLSVGLTLWMFSQLYTHVMAPAMTMMH